jgi:hypothetical protein
MYAPTAQYLVSLALSAGAIWHYVDTIVQEVVSFPFLLRLTFARSLWLNDSYARHLFSSRLSAEMGRWALASELEVNDLLSAGKRRFVGNGDSLSVD